MQAKDLSDLTIRTSYFGNHRKLTAAGFALVSIAVKTPESVPYVLEPVKPYGLVHRGYTPEEYEQIYKERLDKLDFSVIERLLLQIAEHAKTDKIALLCYERPGQFCHRHILSNFLQKHNITVFEYA